MTGGSVRPLDSDESIETLIRAAQVGEAVKCEGAWRGECRASGAARHSGGDVRRAPTSRPRGGIRLSAKLHTHAAWDNPLTAVVLVGSERADVGTVAAGGKHEDAESLWGPGVSLIPRSEYSGPRHRQHMQTPGHRLHGVTLMHA
jgi:hypothetical protein